MSRERFKTTIETGERGRVFITIPFVPNDKWGKKPRHFVTGTLNGVGVQRIPGKPGRSSLHARQQGAPGQGFRRAGDAVTVMIEPQGAGTTSDLPEDLAQALADEPEAREFLEGLSAFYRNTYLKWITEAKKAETRADRVNQTVKLLQKKKKQR